MSELSVRPVQKEDIPAVVALVGAVLAEFGLALGVGSPTDAQLERLPESYDESGGRFWVVENATGALVGTCGLVPIDATTFELRKMYLHESARGGGLGQALLDRTIAFARERGATRLVLDTVDQMAGALRFYERNGFVRDDGQIRGARCNRGYRLDLTGG